MRRAQNADTHALKQHPLSQNIFPICSSFVLVMAFDMHLESESEKRAKNVDFYTTKNIQIQPTLFRYFQTNLIQWLNQKKIDEISILQSADKRDPCTQTASAVPEYFSSLLQFCTGYRI